MPPKRQTDKCAAELGKAPTGSMWSGNRIAEKVYRRCGHRRSSHKEGGKCAFCRCKSFVEPPQGKLGK